MNAKIITEDFVNLFKNYPLYSQENEKDPIIIAKIISLYTHTYRYLTEYNPDTKIAFGFFGTFFYDGWGYVSIEELEEETT